MIISHITTFHLLPFVYLAVQILRHWLHPKLSFFTCNLLSCIFLSPMAFVISAFYLFILQLTPRCSLLYLAANIRLPPSAVLTPTRSCLLAHPFFLIRRPIISSSCLLPYFISSSHLSSSHILAVSFIFLPRPPDCIY
jgi:hypothetical protein